MKISISIAALKNLGEKIILLAVCSVPVIALINTIFAVDVIYSFLKWVL